MTSLQANKVGKFGKIALEQGLVTLAQIQECLSVQMDYERSGKDVPKLGTILLAKGYLTSAQVKGILDKQSLEKENAENQKSSSFIKVYKAGEVIFREGDTNARDLYLIQEGTVELSMRNIQLNERCGPGCFLGITGCLLKTPRSATAITKTKCSIYRIPETQAQMFFRTKPEMAIKLATILAKDLFTIKNQFVEAKLYTKNAPKIPPKPEPDSMTVKLDEQGQLVITQNTSALQVNNKPGGIGTIIRAGDIINFCEKNFSFDASAPQQPEQLKPVPQKPTPPPQAPIKQAQAIAPQKKIEEPEDSEELQAIQEEPEDIDIPSPVQKAEPLPAATVDFAETEPAETAEGVTDNAGEEDSGEGEEGSFEDDEQQDDSAATTKIRRLTLATPRSGAAKVYSGIDEILSSIDQLKNPGFSQEIIAATSKRIDFLLQIEKLEQKRVEIESAEEGPSDRVKNEFTRQRREIQRIPPRDILENTMQKLKDRINPPPPPPPPEDETEDYQPPKPPEPLEADLKEAYDIAILQKQILINRDDSTDATLTTCMEAAVDEPLYQIFAKYEIPSEALFGWGIYAMALKSYGDAQTPRIKDIRKELNEAAENTGKGFLGIGKKKVDDKQIAKLEAEESKRKLILTNVNRELKVIEKEMVDTLWSVYELAALQLVKGVDKGEEPFFRGFLRWGLLGHSPLWFDRKKCKQILKECAEPQGEPVFNMDSQLVFYSDELIDLTSRGLLPPTANEDLELNHRNTPLWKADRSWRKIINNNMQKGILDDILKKVDDEAREIREEQNNTEIELEKVQSQVANKEKKKLISQFKHQIQNFKVKAGRLERIVEKVRDEMLPRLIEDTHMAKDNLTETGIEFKPEDLAMHEIKCMRRNARLVAKLKEPYLPFSLNERYKPENDCVNSRDAVIESIRDAEFRDPLIFKESLIPSAKKVHRILMRIPPIIIVAPANGILGFMMAPRAGVDCGRLVIPAYFERANMREEILWNTLSDFRFDTSKASAGVDIMNSDTLVAAYAEVRWNLRKRDKEVRQKAAIYMEENERTNWRRHYSIYMKSAIDSGKLLFYKCPELYELIINKFIDLPGGCEILKR